MDDINPEQVITILKETLEALNESESKEKLDEFHSTLNNGMLKMMQTIFPYIVQLQMGILKRHNFGESRETIVQFAQIVRAMERDNETIAQLNREIRKFYLPQVNVNSVSASESHVNCSVLSNAVLHV